jgi:hypothetical protein
MRLGVTRYFSASLFFVILASLLPAMLVSQTGVQTQASSFALPGMYQCEGDQCTRGGGGAIWLFDGRRGQAMWHYGAIANLTVVKYDGHTIVIHREDPNPSYSSPRFADPKKRSDGVFFADYVGTIHNGRIDGTVTWNGGGSGPWYATIPESLCHPFEQCPLDLNQLMQLGNNASKAKEYTAALHCFLIASGQGNSDAEALAGIMLRDGLGIAPHEHAAFSLMQKSADQNNYNGEVGLAQMYEDGVGTPKNPEQAAFWKNKAQARLQEMKTAQAQQNAKEAVGILLLLGLAAELDSDSSSSSHHSSSNNSVDQYRQQRERDRDNDYWMHGGTEMSAPPGYKCQGSAC